MTQKYYLAYGSNLNLKQMKYRCPSAKPIGNIILNDYRLVYKGSENFNAYLTIEKCTGYSVPLGVFKISDIDIFSLDIYEEYPDFYSKYYIPIKIGSKEVNALIYAMNDYFDYHIPSYKYVRECLQGYKDFGFNKSVLAKALINTIDNLPKTKKR